MSSGVLWLLCLWWCGGGCGCGGWSLPVCLKLRPSPLVQVAYFDFYLLAQPFASL